MNVGYAVANMGSSPLTRGKHLVPGHRIGAQRLIPAHAGKTAHHQGFAALDWAHPRSRGENCERVGGSVGHEAHPRSRGENARQALAKGATGGSSPLTRGKQYLGTAAVAQRGLIPAHAGKTSLTCSLTPPPRAHPRSRGENGFVAVGVTLGGGSSPLTRGKPGLRCHEDFMSGLIPAHAGKTARYRLGVSGERAHPRSRGENDLRSALSEQ